MEVYTQALSLSREVWDYMNGGSIKRNEDGTFNVSLTRFKPDRNGNAMRRVFYIALTGALAMIGQQARDIPQAIQSAFGPKAFAAYLEDPDVKAAFAKLIKEMVVVTPVEGEGDGRTPVAPSTKPTKGSGARRPSRPAPPLMNMLHEGEMITTQDHRPPIVGFNQISIPEMKVSQ
jgi:hypothetical protein